MPQVVFEGSEFTPFNETNVGEGSTIKVKSSPSPHPTEACHARGKALPEPCSNVGGVRAAPGRCACLYVVLVCMLCLSLAVLERTEIVFWGPFLLFLFKIHEKSCFWLFLIYFCLGYSRCYTIRLLSSRR